MDSEPPVSRRVKQASRVLFTVALMYPDTCYASVRYKLCSFLKVQYFLYFHRLHDQSILGCLLLCVVSVCGFLYLYTLCLSLSFHNISRRAICSEHLASGKNPSVSDSRCHSEHYSSFFLCWQADTMVLMLGSCGVRCGKAVLLVFNLVFFVSRSPGSSWTIQIERKYKQTAAQCSGYNGLQEKRIYDQ